jgi:hypothetical protein
MKKQLIFFYLSIIAFTTTNTYAQVTPITDNSIWQRSQIIPIPSYVGGVNGFKNDISEGWLVKNNPSGNITTDMSITAGWEQVVNQMNNRIHSMNSPVKLFKLEVTIPSAFNDKRIIIRFGGVAHSAKLYVNGKYVRNHWGSNMAWSADITDFVSNRKAVLAIYTDEERKGLSGFISGSGIQREVTLFAVPQNYIVRANAETDLDNNYKDATLRLKMNIKINNPQRPNKIRVMLTDREGKNVRISPSVFNIPDGSKDFYVESSVKNPLKWDAEHPNLYKMTVSLLLNGEETESIIRNIGFREIERKGRLVFINGKEVKFRGMWGGNNAKQLRDINVNHTRQKWATESFLDSCDYYGVYVLDENPVDFAKYGPEIDPQYAYQWLSLTSDLMERDYSHPCVVMWGLGNESFQGPNVLKSYHFAKEEDKQRQVMFSWSNRVKTTEELPFDIYSFHYPNVMFGAKEMRDYGASYWMANSLVKDRTTDPELPVICDEYAHVVLNAEEKNRDPNVRNFWGESIKRFWDFMYNTPGALGGDQFGIFQSLNSKNGIPEIWLLRKAYSPVHFEKDYFELPRKGGPLTIQMQNRFCHTNMNEITLKWKVGNKSGSMLCSDLAPAEYGTLSIPVSEIVTGDIVEMRFMRVDGFQVDEFALPVNPQPFKMPEVIDMAPKMSEDERFYIISGDNFIIKVDKYQGLITSGSYKWKEVITYGPLLQFTGSNIDLREWWCDNLAAHIEDNEAVLDIIGNYAGIWVTFQVRIDGKGLITTHYTIRRFPDAAPSFKTLPWNGTHNGGFSEVGIVYELSDSINRLKWDRKALWTVYPSGHIGEPKGIAFKNGPLINGNWGTFTNDGNTFGSNSRTPASIPESQEFTNDFRGMKEYIRTATALYEGSNLGIQVVSPETNSVRMSHTTWSGHKGIFMIIDNLWNYPQLGLGNYMKDAIVVKEGYSNSVQMRFITD